MSSFIFTEYLKDFLLKWEFSWRVCILLPSYQSFTLHREKDPKEQLATRRKWSLVREKFTAWRQHNWKEEELIFKQDGENSTDSDKDIGFHDHFFNLPLFFVCLFSFVFSGIFSDSFPQQNFLPWDFIYLRNEVLKHKFSLVHRVLQ